MRKRIAMQFLNFSAQQYFNEGKTFRFEKQIVSCVLNCLGYDVSFFLNKGWPCIA